MGSMDVAGDDCFLCFGTGKRHWNGHPTDEDCNKCKGTGHLQVVRG